MSAQLNAKRPTLTRRLMLWALGALIVVWATFVGFGYKTGVHEADELTDGHLASVAALILNLRIIQTVDAGDATAQIVMPELRAHDYQQSLNVFGWDASGHLMYQRGNSMAHPAFDRSEGFADLTLGSPPKVWRTFAQWNKDKTVRVMVMLALEERNDLADDIAEQIVQPGLWLLPVVALALGLAIWRGLRPLYQLSDEVAELDVARTQRLPPRRGFREFDSVVESINLLVDQQTAALERERKLASEVAHELRTPLASITLQAEALQGQMGPAERTDALSRISRDSLQAGHVLNQLLLLARASRDDLHESAQTFDLGVIAQQVAGAFAQEAYKKRDEISVIVDGPIPMTGHPLLMEMAVRNLVENAITHTIPNTTIEVEVKRSFNGAVLLRVRDDGMRGPDAHPRSAGLGLGLQIIAKVATAHGAIFEKVAAEASFTTCYEMRWESPQSGRVSSEAS